jgi:hypothetical protein
MPKRGGELGFSKNYLQELNPTSQNSPLVPTSVPYDSTGKKFCTLSSNTSLAWQF